MTAVKDETGHRFPWGSDCPGWPYCYQPAPVLLDAIVEYEQAARREPDVGPLVDDAIMLMQVELGQREPGEPV